MANSDSVKIEDLLHRATNPANRDSDREALSAFANALSADPSETNNILRLLVHKMQSPMEKEALQALSALEESVQAGGHTIQTEVGKYRFLNELIKLVSPKYFGAKTSAQVKQRIFELMFKWSRTLPGQPKIADAYSMLKQQGVIAHDPVIDDQLLNDSQDKVSDCGRMRATIFTDEEKNVQLQKLLHSKNPEDIQAANRLIKSLVREEEKRVERQARRHAELESVNSNVTVLGDMLTKYRPAVTTHDEIDLMKELYTSCQQLRTNLYRLAGEMDEKEEGIGDILRANDDLTQVIGQYRQVFGITGTDRPPSLPPRNAESAGGPPLPPRSRSSVEGFLLDLSSPTPAPAVFSDSGAAGVSCGDQLKEVFGSSARNDTSSLLDDQLLGLDLNDKSCWAGLDHSVVSPAAGVKSSSGDCDVLATLFDSYAHSTPLLPVSSAAIIPDTKPSPTSATPTLSQAGNRGMAELEELSHNLLQKAMPQDSNKILNSAFNKNVNSKVPLKELQRQQQDLVSLSSARVPVNGTGYTPLLASPLHRESNRYAIPSLDDVHVSPESVQPGDVSPITLCDKHGVSAILFIAKDTPRKDVVVTVVTVTNKSDKPVTDIIVDINVDKPLVAKQQSLSGTELKPYNPIFPASPVTQVVLFAAGSTTVHHESRVRFRLAFTVNGNGFNELGEFTLPTL